MISRDPAVSNIKQTSSSSSSKQTVISTWSGGGSAYTSSGQSVQVDTGLSGTIASSTNRYNFPVLVSVSMPYVVDASFSSYSGWEIKAVLYYYQTDSDIANAVPVGHFEVGDRRTTSTSPYADTIQSIGVLSGQFVVGLSAPTTFYVSIVLQSFNEPVGISFGSISTFYGTETVYTNSVMALTEFNTWIQT
jgi:hypothetical protein